MIPILSAVIVPPLIVVFTLLSAPTIIPDPFAITFVFSSERLTLAVPIYLSPSACLLSTVELLIVIVPLPEYVSIAQP